MKKTYKLLISSLILPTVASGATYTWNPAQVDTSTMGDLDELFSYHDTSNWDGGVVPGSGDSVIIDTSNAVVTASTTNVQGSGSFRINVYNDLTIGSGAVYTYSGASDDVTFVDFVGKGVTLDIAGTLDFSSTAEITRFANENGDLRLHDGVDMDFGFMYLSGTIEYVITAADDVFGFDAAQLNWGNDEIGFDLSGFTGGRSLDGVTIDLTSTDAHIAFTGTTYVSGTTDYSVELDDSVGLKAIFTYIPEPSSTLLIALGGLSLVTRRKR